MQPLIAPVLKSKSPKAMLTRLGGLFAVVLLVAEVFWRLVGCGPATGDTQRWFDIRSQVRNDSNAIVLIGTSRVLCGLDPDILTDELPGYRAYSLAMSGTDPMPVLEDLAQDPGFRGTVICENAESQGFEPYPFRQIPLELKWARLPFSDDQRHFLHSAANVITSRRNSIWSLVDRTGADEPAVVPSSATLKQTRFLPLDFGPRQASYQRGRNRTRVLERYEAWMRRSPYLAENSVFARIPEWVAQIRGRGGEVIFVQMPTRGETRRLTMNLFGDYTRQFESHFQPYIDCNREPDLKDFPSADESHLDGAAARRFSSAFARTLRNRHLIRRSVSHTASVVIPNEAPQEFR